MTWGFSKEVTSLTRRRFLQGTLSGAAGVLAWHQGWPYLCPALAQKGEPSGQMTWAIHVTIAPTWFDPAETPGIITPFMFLYALHDALVKPMPDGPMSPCLATKWSESADGLTYDFELRQGVRFHNGDAFTAEDVKFSFERAKGAQLKSKVKEVVIVDPAPAGAEVEPDGDPLRLQPARAHTELGPAARDDVEGLHRPRGDEWVPEADVVDVGRQPDGRRAPGEIREVGEAVEHRRGRRDRWVLLAGERRPRHLDR